MFAAVRKAIDELEARHLRCCQMAPASDLHKFNMSEMLAPMLNDIGLQPILIACVNCKTPYSPNWPQSYFSSSANGLICRDCEMNFTDKSRLSKDVAACLTSFKQIPASTEQTLLQIEKVMIRHFTELLGRPPRMAKHVLNT